MTTIIDFFDFIYSTLETIVLSINVLFESIINGIRFFGSSMSTIPLFILDLLNDLPTFYKVGITGVFGLLLLVVVLKLFAIVKIDG